MKKNKLGKALRALTKKPPRTDPFERVLNLARKKYERRESDLAKARAQIEAIEVELPGLQAVIIGLENYFGLEPTFVNSFLPPPATPERDETLEIIEGVKLKQPDAPAAPKRTRKLKPGTPGLYVCNKCGGFTATQDDRPICSKCGSADLTAKNVGGPSRPQPNGAGVSTLQTNLPPNTEDDDKFLTDEQTGRPAQ